MLKSALRSLTGPRTPPSFTAWAFAELPWKTEIEFAVDAAIVDCPSMKQVVVVERGKNEIRMEPGRDHWYHQLMQTASDKCEAEALDARTPELPHES